MSTLKVDNLQDTGGKGLFPARAWVNFQGSGTVSIRADENVSSITDNGGGNYTVNQSSGQSDANYAATVLLGNSSGYTVPTLRSGGTHTSSTTNIASAGFDQNLYDRDTVEFTLVR